MKITVTQPRGASYAHVSFDDGANQFGNAMLTYEELRALMMQCEFACDSLIHQRELEKERQLFAMRSEGRAIS